MTFATEAILSTIRPYRVCEIKRRLADGSGNYEASWIDISEYVADGGWPTVGQEITDSHAYGDISIPTITINFDNTQRKFNQEFSADSLWNGYLTRYSTKFKISYGVYQNSTGYDGSDDRGTKVEGNTWYGILYGEPSASDEQTISFSITHILKVFQLYPATVVTDTSSGLTSAIIQRIVDAVSSSVSIFDRFFDSAESITAGTLTAATPSFANETCWGKIIDYSVAENYFPRVNSSGAFVWGSRAVGSNVFTFNGGNYTDATYSQTIVSIDADEDGVNNVFNASSITYDSSGSVATSIQTWTPGDASSSDKYGQKLFTYEILDFNAANAQTFATSVVTNYSTARRRVKLKTTFAAAFINLFDQVTINYEGQISPANALVWDADSWDNATWGNSLGAIRVIGFTGKVLQNHVDLNEFVCTLLVEAV